ncbi:hypothetical protein [Fodinicola acaciae]|uniref:hypothetical protein n=1 Tax=Fodinicola acaciae TaxID=2681555 RepID=UPI0013D1E16A|nr:hypothetical protein [Fodinicola acaciae]
MAYGELVSTVPVDAPVVIWRRRAYRSRPLFAAGTEGIWWRRGGVFGGQVWRLPWSAIDRTTCDSSRLVFTITKAATVSDPALPAVIAVRLGDCRQYGRPLPDADIGSVLERLSGGWVRG